MLDSVTLNGNDQEVEPKKTDLACLNEYEKLVHQNDESYQAAMRVRWHKVKTDPKVQREVLSAMLGLDGAREDVVERYLAEHLTYNDLRALTNTDLELLGFTDSEDRKYLLNSFKNVPHQDASYDDITHTDDSWKYNEEILAKANKHLCLMRNALADVNYKVQLSPPDDVIVGEKSFASRFILEALTELKSVPDIIDKELDALYKIMAVDPSFAHQETLLEGKKSNSVNKWLWRISLTAGVAAALCIWNWKAS